MEIDARARVTVERIENHEAGVGALERIFEDGAIAEVQGVRWRGGGSAQDDQACGIAIQPGEARVNDF